MISLIRTSPERNTWGPVCIHTSAYQPPKYIDIDRRAKKTRFGCTVRLHGIKTVFYKSLNPSSKRVTFFIPAENKVSLIKGWYYVDTSGNSENLNETLEPNMEFVLVRHGVKRLQDRKMSELEEMDHSLPELGIRIDYSTEESDW